MIDSISKSKIPNQYAFILRTGQFEELISSNGINTHIQLDFWLPQMIGSIFEAYYWLPNANREHNLLYIRAGALSKEDTRPAREKMVEVVFPKFIQWVKNIEALPYNSPKLNNDISFKAVYQNGDLMISVYE